MGLHSADDYDQHYCCFIATPQPSADSSQGSPSTSVHQSSTEPSLPLTTVAPTTPTFLEETSAHTAQVPITSTSRVTTTSEASQERSLLFPSPTASAVASPASMASRSGSVVVPYPSSDVASWSEVVHTSAYWVQSSPTLSGIMQSPLLL